MSSSPPATTKKRKSAQPDSEFPESESSSSSSDSSSSESEPETDVPVLSHAEKRRQKKKAALKSNGDEPASKKRKLDTTASTSTPTRQNSIWIGNLSFKTTEDDLRTFFSTASVGEITRIHLPLKPGHKPGHGKWTAQKAENRGFAYVDFATPDAKALAIAQSERPLIGRKVLIKDGDDFTGRPQPTTATEEGKPKSLSKSAQKILSVQKQPPAPTLFMGNLPFETTVEQITELLEAHRKKEKEKDVKDEGEEEKKPEEEGKWILKIRMGTFEDTGLCKGFAFVDFSNTAHATSALTNPRNHHLNGRNLVLEFASADAVRRGPNKSFLGPGEKPREEKAGGRAGNFKGKDRPQPKRKREVEIEEHEDVAPTTGRVEEAREEEEGTRQPHRSPWKEGEKGKGPRHRPKPGAALAQAKRQSAAIIAAAVATPMGKKIVF